MERTPVAAKHPALDHIFLFHPVQNGGQRSGLYVAVRRDFLLGGSVVDLEIVQYLGLAGCELTALQAVQETPVKHGVDGHAEIVERKLLSIHGNVPPFVPRRQCPCCTHRQHRAAGGYYG